MRARFAALLFALFASLLFARGASAQERILDYHADIAIAADGSMDVSESIRVLAEGDRIRHGIYRDFPTDYRDPQHNRYVVGFDVQGATLDGQPVAWHSERRSNGVRVYLGDKDTEVAHGEHSFVLRYRVTRELGFFAGHDELYWNVNGTGWDFDVDKISASVRLPRNVPVDRLQASGYTGAQGSTEQALTATPVAGGADYAAARALGPGENMSIVLDFPKGIIAPPSAAQKLGWLLHDNRNLIWGLLGLLVLWAYYLVMWNRRGRDPASGPKVAEYEPPDGDGAAALRFVRQMGYDNTCFTAGILGIAAKGGLTIERRDDKKWVAHRAGDDQLAALTAPEQALRVALFSAGDDVVFEPSNHVLVQAASKAFQRALKAGFEKKYFFTNYPYLLPGLAISALAAWLASLGGGSGTAVILIWLAGWSFGVAIMIGNALQATGWRAIGPWFMAAMFAGGEVGGLFALAQLAGIAVLPIFVALIATNVAFYFWMRAPTQLGAKLLDRINGFRWYLGVAEKQELDARYTPEARPDLFASYLPYALALGVGNAWAERFANALTPAQMQAAQPGWYSGGGVGNFSAASFASFASDMSSGLAGAIASSSVAPGSGGGGFSGGGGGGGGGGGW